MSTQLAALWKPHLSRMHSALESLLCLLSIYVIPIGIACFSLTALFFWDSQYLASGDNPLALHAVQQSGRPLSPAEVIPQLTHAPAVSRYDTKLSEAPVWFSFTVPESTGDAGFIEFPSRHATDVTCWDAGDSSFLGQASRTRADGALASVKAGFALKLERTGVSILCRANFIGPARLSAVFWPADQFNASVAEYHRKSGLLDGGLIVLALFVLMTAAINRQSLYVLFAAWLILNLRVGALSAGWDIQWLGQAVPHSWLLLSRSITIALYAITTLTLFQTLFRENLATTPYSNALKVLQWLCLPLLLCAILLPFKQFLPVMWLFTSIGLLLMTVSLGSIVFKSHTRVGLWYGASLGVMFLSSLSEIIAAAFGVRELIGLVNSVTAALASSLLTALALAEQMRQEHRQRLAAQAELEHTYEAIPIGLFTLDLHGRFLSANPALRAMLGFQPTAPRRAYWMHYFGEDAWIKLFHVVHAGSEGEIELQAKLPHAANGPQRFLVKAILARDKIEGSLQDVTEKSKAAEELRFMAIHDPLTKVFNRRGIESMFDGAMAQVAAGRPLALAYLDLDRFKLINDLFGHAAGDEVLKQVCDRISVLLASGQQIGRIGGDEFVIIMPGTTIPLASSICRSIIDRISSTPYRVGDKAFHVRCSIGLIDVSPGAQIKDAMSAADHACRDAKSGHGASLVIYEKNAAAFEAHEAELNLVERLSRSDATEHLFIEMQPIMSLKAPQDSLNFEVLLRMRDSGGGTLSAGPIIAAAEGSGRIGMIDRWVLSTTLAWLNTHHERLAHTQFVCMNLSGASLNDERFVQDAVQMLEANSRAARQLCIEITEGVALHDLENTRRFIDKVRNYGARVGLDDFGAGYTSFSYLKELPADVLKIDGSFIVNMIAHPANVAIVEAIVNLAMNLGMKTIAEWAEDVATVHTLVEIGVDYVQGYAVARPQAPDDILSASSSASFIRDEELMRLVRMLGPASRPLPYPDPLEVADTRNLH